MNDDYESPGPKRVFKGTVKFEMTPSFSDEDLQREKEYLASYLTIHSRYFELDIHVFQALLHRLEAAEAVCRIRNMIAGHANPTQWNNDEIKALSIWLAAKGIEK